MPCSSAASGREGKPGETGDFGKAVGSPVIRRPFGAESAGHRLEPHRKAALVPRRLVLVDHFLVGDAVDDAARVAQGFPRGGLVAGLDRPGDALDRAGQRRAQARVVPAPRFGLTGRLARALRIRHVRPWTKWRTCNRWGTQAPGFQP